MNLPRPDCYRIAKLKAMHDGSRAILNIDALIEIDRSFEDVVAHYAPRFQKRASSDCFRPQQFRALRVPEEIMAVPQMEIENRHYRARIGRDRSVLSRRGPHACPATCSC